MTDDVVDPSPRPLPDVIAGRYRIVSRLGVGGMGIVYKAIDLQLNRAVAVKALEDRRLLLPGAASRLRAEALAAASFDHPYVCKVYELAETSTETFMIMEYVEGETLASLLKRGVPPLLQTLQFVREIAEGLASAHARGLVHRDVKPANVMVMPNGHVKLLDFGVAGMDVESLSGEDTRTHMPVPTRLHAGTPHYMAPEQAAGQAVTTRADLFSFGVLLYECLTGALPFSGSTTFDYVRHVMQSAPKRLDRVAPETPAVLVDLVERCLEKTPADRPESADEVVRQLRGLADALTSPGTSVRTAGQVRSGRRWMVAAAGALGLAAIAVALQFAFRGDTTEPSWRHQSLVTTSALESDSKISPDSQWISFIASSAGASRIMMQRIDGGESRPLTLGPGQPLGQIWSPDGSQIAALMRVDGKRMIQIYPAFFGGAPAQSLSLGVSEDRIGQVDLIRWIGRDIYLRVVTTGGGPTAPVVRRLSLDSPAELIDVSTGWKLAGTLRGLDIRPDARLVVAGVSTNGQEDLWVLQLDGSGLRQLTSDAFFDRDPRWLGSGDRIVFQSNRGGQIDLWQIDARTKSLTPLTTGEAEDVVDSTSADGRIISFQQLTKDARLWMFGGGNPRQLTQDSLSDYSPALSANGRMLAFQRSQPAPSQGYTILDAKVFVSEFDGRPVIDAKPIGDSFAPDLSSDGRWLAYMQLSDVRARMSLSVRDLRAGATIAVTRRGGLPSLTTQSPVDWSTRLTAWSPTGSDLYFVEADENDMYALRRYRAGTPAADPPLVRAAVKLTAVTMRDLHASPDTGKLAYIMAARDRVTLNEVDPGNGSIREMASFSKDEKKDEIAQGIAGRGWLDHRFVLTRSIRPLNADRTYDLEVLVADGSGQTRVAGRITQVYASTVRLHASKRVLYMTRSDQGTENAYAFSIDTGALTALTDNQLPGVTFSGFQPAGQGFIGVREERRADIWLIQQVATPRTGNQAGR
ncbi:MAG TPA: protein kinase [Vicinamibacterales bacterium]|nr:protein kinase [Vicinamibacterales bacterium]